MTKQSKEHRLAEKFKRREIPRMTVAQKGDDLFFILDGVKVAVRGKPGTPQAKTWVPLVPGWSVIDTSSDPGGRPSEYEVEYEGVRIH